MKALLDGNFPYIVAETDGGVVGYAYAGPYRTRPAYRFSVEDSVYVDPKAQRLGIGRILLDRLIVESEKRGFRQMIAVIGDSSQTAVDRAAPRRRLRHDRHDQECRIQVRPLARHRADAARARRRRAERNLEALRNITPSPDSATGPARAARGRARGRGA